MDEPDWHLWRAFRAVLRSGSLSAAARELRLTQPTLGRQIAALEAALGGALFTRSTDGLRPTPQALALAPHAEAMAAAAAALRRAASGAGEELRGTIRLAASVFIGGIVLPPILARFRAAHPGIDIELALSDQVEDLSRQAADLAVRNVAPTQSALVARRLGEVPIGFFAHRDYIAAHGMPETVEALAAHSLIGSPAHTRHAAQVLRIPLRFGFACDSDLALHAALRAGFGIGYCQAGIGRRLPELLPVLPELEPARIGLWLVMHEDLRMTRRIRALYDHLAEELTRYLAPPRD